MLCSKHHHRGSLLPWPLEQPPLPFNSMCLFAVRLPYVVCARSAWRCAPPCCLHARLCQRRILLPEASRLQKFFQKRLQLSRHGCGWSSTVLALCLGLQSASRTSSRVCGDTMFSVIILTSALHILSSAESHLVAGLGRQKWFRTNPTARNALHCSRAHLVAPSLKRIDQAQPHER